MVLVIVNVNVSMVTIIHPLRIARIANSIVITVLTLIKIAKIVWVILLL